MKRILALVLVVLLLLPTVNAASKKSNDSQCSFTNITACITDYFFNSILKLFNIPIDILSSLVKTLLITPIKTLNFKPIWQVMVHIISAFYGLLFMYSGFTFLVSGDSPEKRENAKSTLKKIILMIILVQTSFYIYNIASEVNVSLTKGIFDLISKDAFTLKAKPFGSVVLELVFSFSYMAIMFITSLLLVIRNSLVTIGVVFFPFGIAFYFFEPLKSFGSAILNFLGLNMFVSFFVSIVLLTFSKLMEIDGSTPVQALSLASAFLIVDLLLLYVMIFPILKAALNVMFKTKVVTRAFK